MKINQVKPDFPIFKQQVNGQPLVYLDSAATSQKPQVVIDAISHYYQTANANVHRGVHTLSDKSTLAWTESRQTIAQFFGAKPNELIVTRNTTEAINGVAYGWALDHLKPGQVVMVSMLEHHSNLVTWQEMCRRTGALIKLIPVTPVGELDLDWYGHNIDQQVKLVALSHVSNALGCLTDLDKVSKLARKVGARILIDGAQSAPHMPIDFDKLDIDFLAFSGHKMLGPMGIGGLLVKQELLDSHQMKPWLFGGGMIASVSPEKATFQDNSADRFTAGTPDVASLVGLATACQYLSQIGMQNVFNHDQTLVEYALEQLGQIKEVQIVGPKTNRVGSVAFLYKDVHAHDVAQILDSQGIAVRSGHHCTMPLHTHFGWSATIRASFNVYNTKTDINALMAGLAKVKAVFGK
ncbi:SufS family cysteine desulfurase [Patescibacteria group bacterium]|nr:SufS family cysteine desulfurase [Patescibacteria group bacterium]